MKWILWALLLLAQNASFTLVSRARNSSSLTYHAWASALSNGIWFVSQFILVDNFLAIMRSADWRQAVGIGVFYTFFTFAGALGMHAFALKKIERKEAMRTQ